MRSCRAVLLSVDAMDTQGGHEAGMTGDYLRYYRWGVGAFVDRACSRSVELSISMYFGFEE